MSAPTLAASAVKEMHQHIGLEPWEQSLARHIIETEIAPLVAFVSAYDAWAVYAELGGGPLYDAMIKARELVSVPVERQGA